MQTFGYHSKMCLKYVISSCTDTLTCPALSMFSFYKGTMLAKLCAREYCTDHISNNDFLINYRPINLSPAMA